MLYSGLKCILTVAVFILLDFVSLQTAAIAQKYIITDMGTLGGSQSFAYAINDSGQVAGYSWIKGNADGHSFLYSKGKMTHLYPLDSQDMLTEGPTSINNSGHIASGVIVDGIYSSAMYHIKASEIIIFGSLGGVTSYGFNGVATSSNNLGEAVGYCYLDNMNRHAFLYENGVMSDIGSFGGYSCALAINDSGMIVGFASDT
jgi:probable HAF family extracellular repeat protein